MDDAFQRLIEAEERENALERKRKLDSTSLKDQLANRRRKIDATSIPDKATLDDDDDDDDGDEVRDPCMHVAVTATAFDTCDSWIVSDGLLLTANQLDDLEADILGDL